MVYCGKPSKACHECRQRRTRCNEERPSCAQCKRAGRVCSGYRDPLSIMFRNENEKLAGAGKGVTLTTAASTSISRFSEESFMHFSEAQLLPDVVAQTSFLPSAEEQAISYVFSNFVFEDNELATSIGHFDYLPSVYRKLSPGSIVEDAIIALGLAGLANQRKTTKVMMKANFRYSSAVQRVSQILGSTAEARKDEILIAVLLLAMFETTSSDKPRSMTSWSQHINGTSSLLRLRGEAQLHTHIGRRLFVQIRTSVVVHCILRHMPVPPEIMNWSGIAMQYETPEHQTTSSMSFIVGRFCALRNKAHECNDYTEFPAIVAECLEIDEQFIEWAAKTTPGFQYTQITLSEPHHEVFSNYYYIHKDIFVASVWNNWRSMRIILHELLVTHILQLCEPLANSTDNHNKEHFASYRDQLANSRSIIEDMALEICASIPFFFNFHKQDLHDMWVRPPAQAFGGTMLMWPLYTAGVAGRVSPEMRCWIAGRLRFIADSMGIRHAAALGWAVEQSKEICIWEEEPLNYMTRMEEENGGEVKVGDEEEWDGHTRHIVIDDDNSGEMLS